MFLIGQEKERANSFGSVGLGNIPTARFFSEGTVALNFSRHELFSRGNLTVQPYDWFEFSIFYSDIYNLDYPASLGQSYKDKGFSAKFLLSKENRSTPQIAMGLSDFIGTGFYSGEYIVASKLINNFDISLGIGWGFFGREGFKNPLRNINSGFQDRNYVYGEDGEFDTGNYFSGKDASLFGGIEYRLNNGAISLEKINLDYSIERFGIEGKQSNLFYGYTSNRFSLFKPSIYIGNKGDMIFSIEIFDNPLIRKKEYVENTRKIKSPGAKFLLSLQDNDISLEKLEVDQYQNLSIDIVQNSYNDMSNLYKHIDYALDLSNYDDAKEVTVNSYHLGKKIKSKKIRGKKVSDAFVSSNVLFEKPKLIKKLFYDISPGVRTFLASREDFLITGLMIDGKLNYFFNENFYLDAQTTLPIYTDFEKLSLPPTTTYPRQVRSDVKEYLNELDKGLSLESLTLNSFHKFGNNYFSTKTGLIESMFGGVGFEYLNLDDSKNYAIGFELFRVKKRGYSYDFNFQDYQTTTGHINIYKYYDPLKLTAHLSLGKYLAGDKGYTVDLSRRFNNGTTFGAYFSITDVSFEDFGEGAFDKGIYFSIPFSTFGSSQNSNFRWTPLTKDPAQKLRINNRIFNSLQRYIY